MNTGNNKGAVNALLDEYAKAIAALQAVLQPIDELQLASIADAETGNPDCRSIQTVLAHVVRSGFSYCVYIRNSRGLDDIRPEKIPRISAAEYIHDLDRVMVYTRETFTDIVDEELEVFDVDKKMHTTWEQDYDIEQMMEHAIVHILRHRRQVERFLLRLNSGLM